MLNIHDFEQIDKFYKKKHSDIHKLKLFRNAFYKKNMPLKEALKFLPKNIIEDFINNISFNTLQREKRFDSKIDGSSKILLKTQDRHRIEAVLMRISTGRTSLCISSQIGCSTTCCFCATGQMPFIRNLHYSEILDQVMIAKNMVKTEGGNLRNIVFMGMGEPFFNKKNVYKALDILLSTKCFDITPRYIIVSTVGVIPEMERFVKCYPDVGLALSLHSARQEVREKLIDLAKRYPLKDLQKTIKKISLLQKRPLMIEYLMIEDINDTKEDLYALIDYLDTNMHVNLIAFNEFSDSPFKPSKEGVIKLFSSELKKHGFKVTTRYSLGKDIQAACGQLVYKK